MSDSNHFEGITMPMTGITRTSTGISNLDTTHMQNVINNLRARMVAGSPIYGQDAVDAAWLYNYWIQHTHGYYDLAYEQYGNRNPGSWSTQTSTLYEQTTYYVSISQSGGTTTYTWVWGGEFVGYSDSQGIPPEGYSLGSYVQQVYGWEGEAASHYQIRQTTSTYTEYTGGTVAANETSSAITGLDYFDYSDSVKAGSKLTAWIINDLATLVNNIRNHTHHFYDDWLDYNP